MQKKSPPIFIFIYRRKPTLFGKTLACGKKDAYEWPFKKRTESGKTDTVPDGKLRSLAECEVLSHSVLHVVCPVFLAWPYKEIVLVS
jgi:hypothetical protein